MPCTWRTDTDRRVGGPVDRPGFRAIHIPFPMSTRRPGVMIVTLHPRLPNDLCGMRSNMGQWDRSILVASAVLIGILAATDVITGPVAVVLLALAVILVVTSLVRVCPLYLPFGLTTRTK